MTRIWTQQYNSNFATAVEYFMGYIIYLFIL